MGWNDIFFSNVKPSKLLIFIVFEFCVFFPVCTCVVSLNVFVSNPSPSYADDTSKSGKTRQFERGKTKSGSRFASPEVKS